MAVSDLKRSVAFYRQQFGLEAQLDSSAERAALLDSHDHRQQFVLRQDDQLDNRSTKTLGLDYFDVKMFTSSEIAQLAKHLGQSSVDFQYSRPNNFIFVSDPDQINMTFSLL